jgi:hypothetical protein
VVRQRASADVGRCREGGADAVRRRCSVRRLQLLAWICSGAMEVSAVPPQFVLELPAGPVLLFFSVIASCASLGRVLGMARRVVGVRDPPCERLVVTFPA